MSFSSTIGLSNHVIEEFMLNAGATKGRDLRLEVRHIRPGASRDRYGNVVWLEFRAPRLIVVDLTVTSVRTFTCVPRIGARFPLLSSLALGAQHALETQCGPPHFRLIWHAFNSIGL
jgi:hypothetical protein